MLTSASKWDVLEFATLRYTHSGLIIDAMGILKCKQTIKCTRKDVDETPVVFFNISNVHFWYKMLPLDYSEILVWERNSNY
mgnify:CR=1 FL=1